MGVSYIQFLTLEGYGARIRRIDANQAFHQRRFACAVFAHQGMYRSLAGSQLDIAKGTDPWELLGNPLHAEHVFVLHRWLLSRSMATLFQPKGDRGQARDS